MLSLSEPDTFVVEYLGAGKAHRRDDVCNILEERMGKDTHKANLRVRELQNVPKLRWSTKENRFHADCLLHFSLMSELELKQMCPLLSYCPGSSLWNVSIAW